MVSKTKSEAPPWLKAYLESRRPPTKAEIKARRKAFEEALKIRERLDIRPLTTGELIRMIRDE